MKLNLITVNSYAKKRGCTVGYIYQLIDAGRLKAHKIDTMIFINADDVPSPPLKSHEIQ